MGTSSWQENYGGHCFTVIHIVWPCKSVNLSAYAWSSWSGHGYYVEVGDQLDCFHYTLLNYPCCGSLRVCFSVIVPDKRKYSSIAGVNAIPSMDAIYVIFGTLLLLNCAFFVFILHIIYTIFLTKLGIKPSVRLPRWLDKAILS